MYVYPAYGMLNILSLMIFKAPGPGCTGRQGRRVPAGWFSHVLSEREDRPAGASSCMECRAAGDDASTLAQPKNRGDEHK